VHFPSVKEVFVRPDFRYLIIGGLSFVLDFALLALLHEYNGIPAGFAAGMAFAGSALFNYTLQKAFSFGSRGAHGRALPRYLALLTGNLLFTSLVVEGAVLLGFPWAVGKIIATSIVTVGNFFLYKIWVFASAAPDGDLAPS
jgi:putative flippase GtrA